MKRFLSAVLAAVVWFGFTGCSEKPAPPATTDTTVTYKCAMDSCGKTKQAKAGDQTPS